ncbi:MAG: glycosyltransferase family 39 protein [Solirubrobacterales bacterium]
MAVLALAFVLRVWGIKQGLPYVYNVDEASNFVPSALSFFFTDSLNPHYFVNPPAFSYLLHVVLAFWYGGGWPFGAGHDVAHAYAVDPTSVFVVARMTSAVLGTATVAVVYLIGKRLYDRRVGLIAAALMAVAFLPVFYSHLALNDVPALLPLTVSIYGSAGVLTRGRTSDYLLAAVALGFAAATKYTAAIALLPLAAAIVYRLAGAQRGETLRIARVVAVAALAAVAAFVVANPHFVLSFDEFQEGLRTQESESDFGKLGLDQDSGVVYYLWTLTWGLGWLPALGALAGALFALKEDRWRAALLVPWPVVVILFLGLQGRYFGRWLIPALPALAILAALAAVRVAELATSGQRSRTALVSALAIALVAQGLVRSIHVDRVLARDDTRNVLRQRMVRVVPPNSKVVVEPVVPDAWFTDAGRPPPVSSSGRRWVKLPTGRSMLDNSGRPRRGGVGRTVTPEDYQRVLRPELIDSYERGGFCWVVIGSTQYGRSFVSPEEAPGAIAYYRELSRRGDVVERVSPFRQGSKPSHFNFDWSFDYYPFAYERPGPTLIAYRLRGGDCAGKRNPPR